MPESTPPDALLAHAGFLRALARGLLADEADADDLVQETWLRALQSGPSRPEAWPAWLRTVTRNLAFKRLRGRARLRAREEVASRPEALPSALDQIARDESLSGVVAAVLELPEHYREVVMLRFLEGLAPRHIAARLGQPVGTVRMRLHRALKQLREKLDADHDGERDRWRHSLALLVGTPRTAAAPAVALLPWLLLAVLVLGGGWLLVRRPEADLAPPAPDLVPAASIGDVGRPGEFPDDRVREVAESAPVPSATEVPAPPVLLLGVRVVDAAGEPVAGAEVLASNERGDLEPAGRSGADGRAAIRFPPRRERGQVLVAARGAGHAPSLVVAAELGGGAETILVVRGAEARVRGTVRDAAGRPLAGARVVAGEEVRLGLGELGGRRRAVRQPGRLALGHEPELVGGPAFQLRAEVGGFLGAQVLTRDGRFGRLPGVAGARTDAEGRFQLRGLEPGTTRVRIEAPDHAAFEVRLELAPGDLTLDEVVLEREAMLVGRVTRADGLPHAGGVVYAWHDGAPTGVAAKFNPEGAFRLEALPPGSTHLFAETLEGALPALSASARLTLDSGETARWDAVVDNDARVVGRLVDGPLADGRVQPLANWRVELRLDRLPSRTVAATRTRADGTFVLPACPPLPGSLALFPPRGAPLLPAWVVAGVTAGMDLGDVRVPDAPRAIVRGRVLDAGGAPLADTQILLLPTSGTAAHPARTRADGRFATTPLPAGDYDVFVPGLAPGTQAGETLHLEAGGDVEVGSLRIPESARLVLETEGAALREVALRLSRARADGAPLVVFEGRAELPTVVELGAGRWSVDFPEAGQEHSPIALKPGASTRLTVRVR